mmetsp:Transcript_14641/g.57460  ORF Transcript_14641/g.57460 Transcript_14641/m.57460 type:complete len:202 (-) Transcript_14641:310-915(-)
MTARRPRTVACVPPNAPFLQRPSSWSMTACMRPPYRCGSLTIAKTATAATSTSLEVPWLTVIVSASSKCRGRPSALNWRDRASPNSSASAAIPKLYSESVRSATTYGFAEFSVMSFHTPFVRPSICADSCELSTPLCDIAQTMYAVVTCREALPKLSSALGFREKPSPSRRLRRRSRVLRRSPWSTETPRRRSMAENSRRP